MPRITRPRLRVRFSRWRSWDDRESLRGLEHPGVYVLALFRGNPPRRRADPKATEIIYIGETCSQTLRKRLQQFSHSVRTGRGGHAGGNTFHRMFGKTRLTAVFVAVWPVDDGIRSPEFRGAVIRHVERKLIYEYAAANGRKLPKCNKK